jgi:hypothetical protein
VDDRLFDSELFVGAVDDPCTGFGTIPHVARQRGFMVSCADIIDRQVGSPLGPIDGFVVRDFFTGDRRRRNIICNPPLHVAEAFVLHALALCEGKTAVLFPVPRLNAALHGWLGRAPLARVWFLSPRASMPPGFVIAAGQTPGGS